MVGIVKVINLLYEAAPTRTSASYIQVADAEPFIYWDNDAYDGNVKVYYEVVFSSSDGSAAYARLTVQNSGTGVTGAELTTTSTTPVRLRSGDIYSNLTDNTTYTSHVKCATGTVTMYAARLIVVQTGNITKTETQIPLAGQSTSVINNLSVVDNIYSYLYNFDSSQYDGTVNIYFEAACRSSGAGVNAVSYLYDTSGNQITYVSVTGTTGSRQRSGAISLTNGTTYRTKLASGNYFQYGFSAGCRLIIQQTNFTKTESHYPFVASQQTDTTTAGANLYGDIWWNNDFISAPYNSIYFESTLMIDNGAKTAYVDINDGNNDIASVSTSATSKTRVRSSTITLTNRQEYDVQLRISSTSATATATGPRLVIQSNLNGPGISNAASASNIANINFT